MPALTQKIIVVENHMDKISYEFNKCANYVGEIITETKNMKVIMEESYKGMASAGLNDYFTVLNQHLDVMKLCYKQLADYTDMVKEVSLSVDKSMVNFYNKSDKGGAIK